jgi:hypothetical protein
LEQIKKAQEKIKANNIHCYTGDVYDTLNIIGKDYKKQFDLVTIGQAFHWFDEEKILKYIFGSLIALNGTLVITGYKKQRFKINDKLYTAYSELLRKLKPYFECDVDFNDSGYERTEPLFRQYFNNVERKVFEEQGETSIHDIIGRVKSSSGYCNYVKACKDDPAEELLQECLKFYTSDDKVKIYNFYFYICLFN